MKFKPYSTALINLIIIHKRNLLAQIDRVMAFLSRIFKILLGRKILVSQVLWFIFKKASTILNRANLQWQLPYTGEAIAFI